MIQQLRLAFMSYTKGLEILYVVEGVKPAARILVFEDDIMAAERRILDLGLRYARADFKIKMEFDSSLGYSNKGEKIDYESEEKGWPVLYVSKEQAVAERAKMLEEKDDHLQLGLALGYPACCCEFFVRHVEEQSSKNNDYILPVISNSFGMDFDFRNNILLRYFDITLLNHFPHKFDCKESLELAQKHLDVIKKHDYVLHQKFIEALKTKVLYNEEFGIFVFENALYDKGLLRYSGVKATSDNYLVNTFKRNKSVSYDKKFNRIVLEGKKYDEWYLLSFE